MNCNKFIKKYPAFWVPKIGEQVEIVKLLDQFGKPVSCWHKYELGDIGTIVSVDDNLLAINIKLTDGKIVDIYTEEVRLYHEQ